METILLDGTSLTPELLLRLSKGNCILDLTEEAWEKVRRAREVVDDILKNNVVAYGINTGFGFFADKIINESELEQLQVNLIRSHCAGVGAPLSVERTRMLLALRVNVLCKGHSGISPVLMRKFITAYNEDLLSFVPEQGTVGACGDLAPLAHLALGLMGEGLMWDMESKSYKPAGEVLKSNYYLEKNFEPIKLMPKEGLTLINGAQMISSLTTEALLRAENAVKTGDIIAALTLEVLKGTVKATHPSIHIARPHPGQILSASTMRRVLIQNDTYSELNQSHSCCGRVQDSYSLRCVPQVHGIVHDTLKFIRKRLTTELNSATDNPMIFPDQDDKVISGGNFHGEYPAKLADYLAIAIHEVASLSETRVQRLMNTHSSHLPAFLIGSSGLNSGLMISHCTAAALVSENKGLCHPASIDSIPTSAGQEDHVSMGGWAARKALKVVENVERCLAIELLSACQALDLLKPLKTTAPLEMVHSLVRVHVPFLEQDSILSDYIEKLTDLIRSGAVYSIVNA